MESEGPLLCSREPATGACLSHVNKTHIPNPISLRPVLILSSHLRLGLLSVYHVFLI